MPPWADDLIQLALGPAGLAVFLLFVLYGLHREWWVIGAQYRECLKARHTLEAEAKATTQAKNDELIELRAIVRHHIERPPP